MYHHRRKSGHNTSYTDVRKAVTVTDPTSRHKSSRPTMTRRGTSQFGTKLGKNPRDREREMEDDHWLSDERESFPLFCMTCEKQFVPRDEKAIYCSEACRAEDHPDLSPSSSTPRSLSYRTQTSPNYPFYAAGDPEPRDIIPRASPSRPHSMLISPPTPPQSASHHTSAMSALRSLSAREPSPPSPSGSYPSTIWPYTMRGATSPGTSYSSRPSSTVYSSTYESYGYTMTSQKSERPLPSRSPATYSRPKSIELVTPIQPMMGANGR